MNRRLRVRPSIEIDKQFVTGQDYTIPHHYIGTGESKLTMGSFET